MKLTDQLQEMAYEIQKILIKNLAKVNILKRVITANKRVNKESTTVNMKVIFRDTVITMSAESSLTKDKDRVN
jgi:hypothetical protein